VPEEVHPPKIWKLTEINDPSKLQSLRLSTRIKTDKVKMGHLACILLAKFLFTYSLALSTGEILSLQIRYEKPLNFSRLYQTRRVHFKTSDTIFVYMSLHHQAFCTSNQSLISSPCCSLLAMEHRITSTIVLYMCACLAGSCEHSFKFFLKYL